MRESRPVNVDVQNKSQTWLMFDRIAKTYDPLNRVLSMGIDHSWRRKMATYVPEGEDLSLLDLATGTGDQLIALCRSVPHIRRAVGMDMSQGMLDIGRQKLETLSLGAETWLEVGDATQIPAQDATYDVTSISFGIRNVDNVSQALSEMYRVLKPGGRSLILEFALPDRVWFRSLYLLYFRKILPWIGSVVSGDRHAYSYLNQSVEAFPYGESFCQMMRDVGFVNVQAHRLTLNIAMIYQGDKL